MPPVPGLILLLDDEAQCPEPLDTLLSSLKRFASLDLGESERFSGAGKPCSRLSMMMRTIKQLGKKHQWQEGNHRWAALMDDVLSVVVAELDSAPEETGEWTVTMVTRHPESGISELPSETTNENPRQFRIGKPGSALRIVEDAVQRDDISTPLQCHLMTFWPEGCLGDGERVKVEDAARGPEREDYDMF